MRYLEESNSQRHKVKWWLPGAEGRGEKRSDCSPRFWNPSSPVFSEVPLHSLSNPLSTHTHIPHLSSHILQFSPLPNHYLQTCLLSTQTTIIPSKIQCMLVNSYLAEPMDDSLSHQPPPLPLNCFCLSSVTLDIHLSATFRSHSPLCFKLLCGCFSCGHKIWAPIPSFNLDSLLLSFCTFSFLFSFFDRALGMRKFPSQG